MPSSSISRQQAVSSVICATNKVKLILINMYSRTGGQTGRKDVRYHARMGGQRNIRIQETLNQEPPQTQTCSYSALPAINGGRQAHLMHSCQLQTESGIHTESGEFSNIDTSSHPSAQTQHPAKRVAKLAGFFGVQPRPIPMPQAQAQAQEKGARSMEVSELCKMLNVMSDDAGAFKKTVAEKKVGQRRELSVLLASGPTLSSR